MSARFIKTNSRVRLATVRSVLRVTFCVHNALKKFKALYVRINSRGVGSYCLKLSPFRIGKRPGFVSDHIM